MIMIVKDDISLVRKISMLGGWTLGFHVIF